jgi:hypothetical protein
MSHLLYALAQPLAHTTYCNRPVEAEGLSQEHRCYLDQDMEEDSLSGNTDMPFSKTLQQDAMHVERYGR